MMDDMEFIIRSQIEQNENRAKILYEAIVAEHDAGMDTRQKQKWYEDYVEKNIELEARLRQLIKETES